MKKLVLFVLSLPLFISIGFAQDYIYFYGNGCSHCQKVEKFFQENNILEKFNVKEKEVYFNAQNREEFLSYGEKFNMDPNTMGIPMLIVNAELTCNHLVGDKNIIDYFEEKMAKADEINLESCEEAKPITGVVKIYDKYTVPDPKTTDRILLKAEEIVKQDQAEENDEITNTNGFTDVVLLSGNLVENNVIDAAKPDKGSLKSRLAFFGVMLPAAISDSINPCEFAIIILLLSTILIKTQSRKKAILTGLSFSFAIFVSYFLLGLGLWKVFSSSTNTNLIKIIAGSLGVLVGLANLKDVFRYGKGFVMEVPFARRDRLQAFVKSITSPVGAFFIGIVVSLFLLPCTSGPYLTILSYLSAENVDKFWGLIYLFVYNIFFIIPMVLITLLVTLGTTDTQKLSVLKDKYNWLIHLVVGLLMLGLGLYVFTTL